MNTSSPFLKSVVRLSPASFTAVDLLANEFMYSLGESVNPLGYSNEELQALLKDKFHTVIHPEDIAKADRSHDALLRSKNGEVIDLILRIKKSDGNFIWVQVRKTVFERDEFGSPTKYSALIEDISSIMHVEEVLRDKVETLKNISFKNSHELRAPVANILGLIDLLRPNEFICGEQKQIFDHLTDTVKKLDEVIHEFNDFLEEKSK